MPVPYSKTKAGRAAELLRKLDAGPAFSDTFTHTFTPKEAAEQYRRWAQSWIVPEVRALVPQLADRTVKPRT